ncbi:MAG TPA: PEP-CTERM sorting domain-containing protein [Gammaproteobacteria bacterium]|nr:PEP-CTERM sorting domain-containing protein [Gammaproteobacteria bacterium]
MKKRILLAIFIAAAGALSVSASAGVIYHWQQLTTSPTISSSSGILEISDQAWLSGHIELTQTCAYFLGGCSPSLADSPILTFEFGINGMTPVHGTPAPDDFSKLNADLDITSGGLLSGNLYGEDFTGRVDIGGTPGQWEVGTWVTDEGCWMDIEHPFCSGATGRWVLDRSTIPAVPVPEPASLPLLFLGLAIVLWVGHRRSVLAFKQLRGQRLE